MSVRLVSTSTVTTIREREVILIVSQISVVNENIGTNIIKP